MLENTSIDAVAKTVCTGMAAANDMALAQPSIGFLAFHAQF